MRHPLHSLFTPSIASKPCSISSLCNFCRAGKLKWVLPPGVFDLMGPQISPAVGCLGRKGGAPLLTDETPVAQLIHAFNCRQTGKPVIFVEQESSGAHTLGATSKILLRSWRRDLGCHLQDTSSVLATGNPGSMEMKQLASSSWPRLTRPVALSPAPGCKDGLSCAELAWAAVVDRFWVTRVRWKWSNPPSLYSIPIAWMYASRRLDPGVHIRACLGSMYTYVGGV